VNELSLVDALALELSVDPVAAEQVIDGSPQTGLWESDSEEWGVWEMTSGVMSDVEVDEFFVVIAGEGTLERTVGGVVTTTALRPGVVCRLSEGEQTVWRVTAPLRKVYWVPTT